MSCSVCERETEKQHNNAVSQRTVCLPCSRALPLQLCLEIVSARLFLKLAAAQTVVLRLHMRSAISDRVHRGDFNSDLHCLYEWVRGQSSWKKNKESIWRNCCSWALGRAGRWPDQESKKRKLECCGMSQKIEQIKYSSCCWHDFI